MLEFKYIKDIDSADFVMLSKEEFLEMYPQYTIAEYLHDQKVLWKDLERENKKCL